MLNMVTLKNNVSVPALGQGTWYLGENPRTRGREIEAIRTGINAGMTLIDTAEMYGNGKAEEMIGEAIHCYDRKSLFLVSKVLPANAGGKRFQMALEGSLSRLGTDYLDLYLYHWRGSYPLSETIRCMEQAKADGLIKDWGVSNFDIDDMEELFNTKHGDSCTVNQVLYNTGSRGIEYCLLPWMMKHHVTLMSYCPLAQGGTLRRGLLDNPVIKLIAKTHDVAVTEILLAWNIRNRQTIAIPRTGNPSHTLLNAHADSVILTEEEISMIDSVYSAPTRKEALEMQ